MSKHSRQGKFYFIHDSDAIHASELNRERILDMSRNRLLVAGAVFTLAFLVIAARVVDLTMLEQATEPRIASAASSPSASSERTDIVDRNGAILASSLPTSSLYADPADILDAVDAADKLAGVLPGLNPAEVLAKLKSKSRFVWLRRNLTPKQVYEINGLGLPGLFFQSSESRVYPHGRILSHVLGFTDIDGRGIAGLERHFDQLLRRGGDALKLSIDIRIQDIMYRELSSAMREFKAIGAAGLVLDVNTGETLAMVSLPDFDPNAPMKTPGRNVFNRVTNGVYEMGSTFKLFNTAMALDSGTVTLNDGYDTSKPIQAAKFTITDFHGRKRWLSVPEILVYSSNIGSAKMAMDLGTKTQRSYLGRLGLLKAASIELPEIGSPLHPSRWRDINTMTISYGHGIAVSPLQVATAVAGVVNGGIFRPATLLKQPPGYRPEGTRILSKKTSLEMRSLMRMVVLDGTGRKADAPGYRVGGKTGTAEKISAGEYRKNALISSFVGVFPIDAPKYVVLALLDEPKGDKKTFNYATGGWVAAPVVRRVVQRMGPLLGIVPSADSEPLMPDGMPRLAALRMSLKKAQGRQLETY